MREMGRLVILPTGVSIIRNLERERGLKLQLGREAEQLKGLEIPASQLASLSAELALLVKLKASSADTAVFLATDTDEAECAANANAVVARNFFQVDAEARRIRGLELEDANVFLKTGLRNFFNELDRCVRKAEEAGLRPVIGIAGGIKPVIPYSAVYGMLRRVSLYYVFEKTQALVELPPLPLDFDWAGLRLLEKALLKIEQEVAVPADVVKRALGEDFPRFEALFEEIDGSLTLSSFGHLILGTLQASQEVPVMLSERARRKVEWAEGEQRQQIELLLDRVRNPIWRASKRHEFRTTDLEVWKPGNCSLRLAGWVESGVVYVAEIYFSHDEYEKDLMNRRRNGYDRRGFSPYYPKPLKLPEELLEESGGDEFQAVVLREKKRAEQERDQAFELAKEYEQKAKELEEELAAMRAEVERLRRLEEERRLWSVWRRLRWALFGR